MTIYDVQHEIEQDRSMFTAGQVKIMDAMRKLLFEHKYERNETGATKLHQACQDGDLEMVQFLIEKVRS